MVENWAEAPESPPRVCVLCRMHPFTWIHHYVAALRNRCDVITVGPAFAPEELARMDRAHLAHTITPPDIGAAIEDIDQLPGLLPSGWKPDLLLTIQSGLGAVASVERLGIPSVYLSVDTWHDLAELLYARHYDFVFAAQRSAIPLFEATGAPRVYWLPLACDPQVHGPAKGEERFDFAFVGSCTRNLHNERIKRLETLGAEFTVATADALSQEQMRLAYAGARAAFNSSLSGEVNMRVFETLCMRKPLLTDRGDADNGLLELFQDDVHLLTYRDDTMLDRARTLCADPVLRERLAAAGHREVLAKHTYLHRVDTLLSTITPFVRLGETGRAERSARRPGLHTLLPAGARFVVDWGMALNVSRVALRHRGIERLIGIADSGTEAKRSSASYDEVRALPDSEPWGEPADAIALHALPLVSREGTNTLRMAHGILRSGGTLVAVLRTPPPGFGYAVTANDDAVVDWVRSVGFAVLSIGPIALHASSAVESILIARKRDLTLREAARRMYAAHPLPHLSQEEIESHLPADL